MKERKGRSCPSGSSKVKSKGLYNVLSPRCHGFYEPVSRETLRIHSDMGLSTDLRWKIIAAYGQVLERCSSPIEKETELPFPKETIRKAIVQELIENPDSDLRSHLEIAFVQLESFLPPDDYKVLEDFKAASRVVQEMLDSGNPYNIVASARILKGVEGDSAVRIQESVSEKMRKRLMQIQAIGSLCMS